MRKVMSGEEMIELQKQGLSCREIAVKAGISEQGVQNKMYKTRHPEKFPKRKKRTGPLTEKELHRNDAANYTEMQISTTGEVVNIKSINGCVEKLGDEKVTAFVNYHLEMFKMRQGCDKYNVDELYERFVRYLIYCAEHTIMPNNQNAYFAIGITATDITEWKSGRRGTPRHKQFAEEVTQFFASVHEQAPTQGLMNPISAMFWQKAYDGMIEASKVEQPLVDALGDKKSAEDIARKYADVELPDD